MERLQADGHEMVVFCSDAASGLRAIVAIHDTTLGRGMGGFRMRAYGTPSSPRSLTAAGRA